MGLTLEAWLYFPQLPELAAFSKAVPDLTIILNHIGGLLRTGPYANRDQEVMQMWQRGVAAVAACPNVSMAPLMTYCIEQFGPSRCMFESNFPVDKVSYSHHVLYNAFKRMSKGYSAAERAAMFHDNAVRVYRVDTT